MKRIASIPRVLTKMTFLPAPECRTELRELYVDVPGDSLHQAATSGVFLNENESEFFDAIKTGNIDLVRSKLNNEDNPVNINAINSDGLTALQIAAKSGNSEIIKELLGKGADLNIALLQCVVEKDSESVAVLILSNHVQDIGLSGDNYITPSILAAQLGHYEIVHFLIENNYLIKEPHECECFCDECNGKSDMLLSQIAINRFRGLASPVYMCLRWAIVKTIIDSSEPFKLI